MKFQNSFVAALLVFCPALTEAQSAPDVKQDEQSHFGVVVNFTKPWIVSENLKALFGADSLDVHGGSDFEIGFIRGRDLGGDWGISLVHKSIRDGSVVERGTYESCFGQFGCALNGNRYYARGVSLFGVEIHKYIPFAVIKKRAQIGMNFGGGIAKINGYTEWHALYPDFVTVPGGLGRIVSIKQGENVSQAPASWFFLGELDSNKAPLAKVEIAAAALIVPGLKVRVNWGLNFPATTLNVTASYLFGAK